MTQVELHLHVGGGGERIECHRFVTLAKIGGSSSVSGWTIARLFDLLN